VFPVAGLPPNTTNAKIYHPISWIIERLNSSDPLPPCAPEYQCQEICPTRPVFPRRVFLSILIILFIVLGGLLIGSLVFLGTCIYLRRSRRRAARDNLPIELTTIGGTATTGGGGGEGSTATTGGGQSDPTVPSTGAHTAWVVSEAQASWIRPTAPRVCTPVAATVGSDCPPPVVSILNFQLFSSLRVEDGALFLMKLLRWQGPCGLLFESSLFFSFDQLRSGVSFRYCSVNRRDRAACCSLWRARVLCWQIQRNPV